MSDITDANMNKLTEAKNHFKETIKSLKAGELTAADEASDNAYAMIEEVRTDLTVKLQAYGTEVNPTRDKIDNALSTLDEVSSELENLGRFDDADEDEEVEDICDTIEGFITAINEISL